MKKAVYPGSFDPITLGHIDIIERAAPLYDEFIVLVARSHNKKYLFSDSERIEMVQMSLPKDSNIKVEFFDGLTVDYAKSVGANVIVRGIRAVSDFEYEMAVAHMNKRLSEQIETLIMLSSPNFTCISSRMVKEVASYHGDLKGLIPDFVIKRLQEKNK